MGSILALIILLGISGLEASPDGLPSRHGDEAEKADKLYEQKRYDLALTYYKQLLSDNPAHEIYLYKAGYCFLQVRQYEAAISTFTKLLNINPTHIDALLNIAYTLKIVQRHSEAELHYERLSELMPRTAAHLMEGCRFAYSDYTLPTQFFVKSADFNNDHADFFINLLHNRLVGSTTQKPVNPEHKTRPGPTFHVEGENSLYYMNTTQSERKFYRTSFPYSKNIGPISFAKRTGLIAYTVNNFTEGVRQVAQASQKLKIRFAYLNEVNDWVDHTDFEYNSADYSVGYPYLTPDGSTLYFASNMPGGYGGFDIYVSYFVDSTWTVPQNLGPRINTPGDEISPFFDGKNLYFSSDWHHGFGGLDIFKADFDYESWTDPVNLGPMVNSSFDDFNFVFIESLAVGYFCSDRPADNENENIYEVRKKSKQITLKISDLKEGTALTGVEVDLSRCGLQVGITDENGVFNMEITEGFDCIISLIKVGYKGTSFTINYNDIKGPVKNYNIRLSGTVNFYSGQILEDSSMFPVKGVYISVVNELDGELQETYTDNSGIFSLHIKPRGKYHLSFAKTGYLPLYINLTTGNKVNPNVLGTMMLKRAGNLLISDFYRQDVFVDEEKVVRTQHPNFNEATASIDPFPDKKRKETQGTLARPDVKPIVVQQKSENNSSRIEDHPALVADSKSKSVNEPPPAPIRISDFKKDDAKIRGYVIQVAAISKKKVDFTPFKYYLSKYGELFVSKRDDNLIRIMVGIYDDKDEAEEALLSIRDEKFKEAFITPLPMGIRLDSVEDYKRSESKNENAVKVADAGHLPTEEFMVNLGQFNNMIWFDNREVEAIGLIEERKENGKVIVLLSGYTSKEEASRAMEKVKKLGYKNAQVVKNGKGGKLVPVK